MSLVKNIESASVLNGGKERFYSDIYIKRQWFFKFSAQKVWCGGKIGGGTKIFPKS